MTTAAAGPAGAAVTFYRSGARPASRLVSATTVFEEALADGRWIGLYWSASGQVQRENTVAGLPGLDPLALPLQTFALEIDGQALANRWEWAGAVERPGGHPGTTEAAVTLRYALRPVTVTVVTRLDGTPFLVRWLEIANTGDRPAALGAAAPWAGVLWNTPAARAVQGSRLPTNPSAADPSYRVGYFANDFWGGEGDFRWQPLERDTFRIQRSLTGRVFGAPYFLAENGLTGQRFLLALAWSNNYSADFALHDGSCLSARLAPLAPAPLRVIAPGETVTSPAAHLGPWHGTLDGAVAAWHAHVRDGVAPPRPAGRAMYTVAGRVVEEPGNWILREIDIAAEMGVEAFMVDAGWYGADFGEWTALRGDWQEGHWLPGGLVGIRQYCHDRGLLFGLWHEAEALTRGSRLFADHPDWQLTNDGLPCGETLDLANPAAAAFFEETVLRLLHEHQLDFYKLDYNVNAREGGQSLRDGYAESESWRHHEVLARTFTRARREFPDACLENCASGGGRLDIGMLAQFHYACESDWSVHPSAIRALNALTLFIPPEALCYYHNHVNWGSELQAHQVADADTHLRVALFALPIFVGFGAQGADRESAFYRTTRRYIGLHRGFCRPVLAAHPAVFHHTPDIGLTRPAPWCVLEYAARDRSRGYAGVFKLSHDTEPYLLHLRGVDRGATYRVTLDNSGQTFAASGRELAGGLCIELDAALTSELVLYERQECGG